MCQRECRKINTHAIYSILIHAHFFNIQERISESSIFAPAAFLFINLTKYSNVYCYTEEHALFASRQTYFTLAK